jgi:activator of HSP90 ATPase
MSQPDQSSIHQEVTIKASPQRVYDALTNAERFSAFTGGAPAQIDAAPGGAFSGFGGMIVGRNIELVPNQRVVQAWRVANWSAGVYSIAKFELQADGPDTKLVFDQAGFPADQVEHLAPGWHKMYWDPLKKYLG